MSKKRFFRITIVFGLLITLVLIFLNTILEKTIVRYLENELFVANQVKDYNVTIGDLDVNIFKGQLKIKNISVTPSKVLLADTIPNKILQSIQINNGSLSGLGVYDLVVSKDISISSIIFDKFLIDFYLPENSQPTKETNLKKHSTFSLDSIRIPKIKNIDLGEIRLANYDINIIKKETNDTLSSFSGEQFVFKGIDLDLVEGTEDIFALDKSNLEVHLEKQAYNMPGGLYYVAFDKLYYRYTEQDILLTNFELKPIGEKQDFSKKFDYAFEIYEATVDTLLINAFDSNALLSYGAIVMGQINISGLDFSILKDKSKPWNLNKRPKLPHTALKEMKHPLHVDTITIKNSKLTYIEKLETTEKLLKVDIFNLNGTIKNVTSYKENQIAATDLTVDLHANMLNALPVSVNLKFPYTPNNDTFYFSGFAEDISQFNKLNPIIYPAILMKFKSGSLDGLNFNGSANNYFSKGNLTILYSDLELEIYSQKDNEDKKLSWLANSLAKKSNPNKNGKTTVGEIDFERIQHKGLGNFFWKSIQSGIVNSLSPIGKQKKIKAPKPLLKNNKQKEN